MRLSQVLPSISIHFSDLRQKLQLLTTHCITIYFTQREMVINFMYTFIVVAFRNNVKILY